jgi:hypothetical protein
MIDEANATADKYLEDRYYRAKVEANQLSDTIVEWLQNKPVSNALAICLAIAIILID